MGTIKRSARDVRLFAEPHHLFKTTMNTGISTNIPCLQLKSKKADLEITSQSAFCTLSVSIIPSFSTLL